MPVSEIRIDGVRNLSGFVCLLHPKCNVFVGPNGAGKTSVLEALSYLAVGRSFRSGRHREVISRGGGEMVLFLRMLENESETRLGFRRDEQNWEGRVNGNDVSALTDLARIVPWSIFHPGSHELIEGGPEFRRRLLDWTVFHVEPDYLSSWRRFRRAMRQRNSSIRSGRPVSEVVVWDRDLSDCGAAIDRYRTTVFAELGDCFSRVLARLAPELEHLTIAYRRGWAAEKELLDVLAASVEEDCRSGYTRAGPHRSDLVLSDSMGRVSKRLSRGQQKVVCLALVLSQAQILSMHCDGTLLMALDDLGSELDQEHQEDAIKVASEQDAQLLITGVQSPPALAKLGVDHKVFHVEHGQIVSGY